MKEDPSSGSLRIKKTILKVIVLIVLAFGLIGCSNEELENNLYNLKTSSIKSEQNVNNILASLSYPKEYEYSNVEILSRNDSSVLKVYLKENVPNNNRDFFENAVVLFSLVDDVDSISFVSEKRNEILDSHRREDIDILLGEKYSLDTRKIGENKENFNKYLSIKERS
ncbi:DUF4825 domain-containing protein [Peptoniphilus stercorisuis]|uniref:DUF4825 domain-containing protein n=1 Tax=Peptoniphilus stercorisuis TaxID=1436965 RepID=A0ABS4KAD5_9FIRM|nr:DUF4825 domain-containing protein [Peptoniphilus stercorisuis]MBP2024732.1 hypothetical protein [Peptoniphilus stercorisuis]